MEANQTSNYLLIDDCHYVDSDFLNNCKGKIEHSELKHLGMGDFYLQTPNGKIYFFRANSKPSEFSHFVGRVHNVVDDRDGMLVDELLTKMNFKK